MPGGKARVVLGGQCRTLSKASTSVNRRDDLAFVFDRMSFREIDPFESEEAVDFAAYDSECG